jgi:Rrf2 family protein
MSTSSRLAVAVHVLALLALDKGRSVTSDRVAGSVNTTPAVIRRILGSLHRAGLVTTQPGAGGGASLVCRPEAITLLDVYRAVEAGDLFPLPCQPPNPLCPCGRSIHPV